VLDTCMYPKISLLSLQEAKSRQYPSEGQAYLDVQGPCRIVVSTKGKFF
jgi:hypothetical protein